MNQTEYLENFKAITTQMYEIKDLKVQVETLETEVKLLTEKVEGLKSFNKTIIALWSGFILFVSIFGKDLINRIF